MSKSFDEYFSAGELNCFQRWIINLFIFDLSKMPHDDNLKENFIEIKSCPRLQLQFDKLKLEDCWCAAIKAFPSHAVNAVTVVLPFSTIYLYKSGFSTIMYR